MHFNVMMFMLMSMCTITGIWVGTRGERQRQIRAGRPRTKRIKHDDFTRPIRGLTSEDDIHWVERIAAVSDEPIPVDEPLAPLPARPIDVQAMTLNEYLEEMPAYPAPAELPELAAYSARQLAG